MKKLSKILRKFLLAGLFFIITFSVSAQNPVRAAFLSMDNLSTDPRYDYLSGIIQGILLFDLSDREGLELVERSDMESVIIEQKLVLSGLLENTKDAMNFGEMLRAHYLMKGEYVFMGQDILLTTQIEFRDWEAAVRVEPGKQAIAEDRSSHFNELLNRMNYLARDRKGVPHEGSLTLNFTLTGEKYNADFILDYNGISYRSTLAIAPDEKAELKENYGLIDLSAELSDSAGRCETSFYLTRTDVRQGLHREERQ